MRQIKRLILGLVLGSLPGYSHEFYESYVDQSVSRWETVKITYSDLIPKAGGPLEKEDNDTILWALDEDGNRITGFRSINTVTDCQSGCTPVQFHLQFTPQGDPVKVFTKIDKPLRKLDHAPFSPEDMEKLNHIVRELPEMLSHAMFTMDLTDNFHGFPPQTWTYFQDTVIPQGAYTTFVVFHQARLTKIFVSGKVSPHFDTNAALSQLMDLEWHPVSTESLRELISLLNGNDTLFWSNKNRVITFLKALAIQEKGPEFLNQFFQDISPSYTFPYAITHYLPLLVPLYHRKTLVDSPVWKEHFTDFLKFCSFNETVMTRLMDALEPYEDLAIQALAHGEVYFSLPKLSPSMEELKKKDSYATYFEREKTSYLKNIYREFSEEGLPFPKGDCHESAHPETPVEIPLKTESKRIYLFFASWCGHCLKTVGSIWKQAPEELRNAIQLVEVFSYSPQMLEPFATRTGVDLEKDHVLALSHNRNEDPFYRSMSLYAVPKIVVVNGDQEIINFDLKIPSESSRLIRDLSWILARMK